METYKKCTPYPLGSDTAKRSWNVSSRLAAYLLTTADKHKRNEFVLEINKSQLASRLGTISETLSRAFRKLKDQGIIGIEKDTISILSRQALEDMSIGLSKKEISPAYVS